MQATRAELPTTRTQPASSRLARREAIEFYLFISPWIVGFLVFALGPTIASFAFSFTDWTIIAPPVWAGLKNYVTMFTGDPLFGQSLKVTALYAVGAIPLYLVTALFVAMLLNQRVRGESLFRTIYYMPNVISGVAVSVLWVWLLNPEFGLVNLALGLVGIKGPAWIYSETWVIPSLVLMNLWGVGNAMIIFLAGLQGIPTALYEAASVDGANAWHRLIHVTLPMLSPVIFFNLILGVIGSFQVFTQAFVMTRGGPHDASLFYVLNLYNNAFQYFKMGYAAALAWVLFLIILALTLVIFRSSTLWLFYEGELRGRR